MGRPSACGAAFARAPTGASTRWATRAISAARSPATAAARALAKSSRGGGRFERCGAPGTTSRARAPTSSLSTRRALAALVAPASARTAGYTWSEALTTSAAASRALAAEPAFVIYMSRRGRSDLSLAPSRLRRPTQRRRCPHPHPCCRVRHHRRPPHCCGRLHFPSCCHHQHPAFHHRLPRHRRRRRRLFLRRCRPPRLPM